MLLLALGLVLVRVLGLQGLFVWLAVVLLFDLRLWKGYRPPTAETTFERSVVVVVVVVVVVGVVVQYGG